MHCSRRRLLLRGLEFHVCTINKSAHTKKSQETFSRHLVRGRPIRFSLFLDSNIWCEKEIAEYQIFWLLIHESSIEQVLATTPHETPTIRTLAPHHENYTSSTSQTRRTLLEKQGRTHKWCTYGCAKAGRPARTYIQQLCEDMGCNPEDRPEAMNDREKWRERVRDIRAGGTTWWWWFICLLER